MQTLNASTTKGTTHKIHLAESEIPDSCPICHSGIVPRQLSAVYAEPGSTGEGRAFIAYQCSRDSCQNIFVGVFDQVPPENPHFTPQVVLRSTWPKTAPRLSIPEEIEELSPTFAEVYRQAFAAEAHGLTQLTGVGMRKALEFLIKDFAIHRKPEDEQEIRKAFLATVINDHIEDPNVKSSAERAAWLGNDETHFSRRWEDHDISDLKVLLRLAMNWTHNVLLTERYERELNSD